MFWFLFPIILFNSTDETSLKNTSIPAHELHFTQMCEQYLLYQAKGNQELAAVRLGVVNELASHLQE